MSIYNNNNHTLYGNVLVKDTYVNVNQTNVIVSKTSVIGCKTKKFLHRNRFYVKYQNTTLRRNINHGLQLQIILNNYKETSKIAN